MLSNKWLNTFGLILGMAGVIIIFFYGPPQPVFLSVITDSTNPYAEQKAIHEFWSRVGLLLIGIGFLTQLIAVWIKPRS